MGHAHAHDADIIVKSTGHTGLKHFFAITIPAQAVEDHVVEHLKEYGNRAKIPGFRPGKVPMPVLQQKFRPAVMREVIEHMADAGIHKALNDNKLRPALQPKVEIASYEDGKDLEIKVDVEVIPEMTPMDFSTIALERLSTKPADAEIDEAIKNLAESMAKSEPRADGAAAQMGDMLSIDFAGTINGVAKDGMQGENMRVQLGKRQLIDTFEDQMVGMKIGDEKTIKVTFPENYHAKDLAGQPAEFHVKVNEIGQLSAPAIDDEFAKQFGMADAAELRTKITERLQDEYDQSARLVTKRKLLDILAEKHSFDIPQGMVEAEFNQIWQRLQQEIAQQGKSLEDADKSDDEMKADYRKIAERRVRLGLLMADVAQKQDIQVPEDDMRNALLNEMRRYPQQSKEVMEYYQKTPGALESLRAPLLEERVVDHILAQAKVTEKTVTAEELGKAADELTA